MKSFMNQLFLTLFFLLQITNSNLFASQDKADLFIQKFPRLTFPKAKKRFGKLTNNEQTRVWDKLDANENDKDRILPLALRMAHMEPALQYAILSEDFKIFNKKNTYLNVPQKMHTNSIYDLFRWKAVINKKCGKNEYARIRMIPAYSGESYIRLSQTTLFNLTIDQIKTIPKIRKHILTKKEVQLLAELSDDALEELKRWCNGNKMLKFFYYKNPTITSALMEVLDTAVFIVPPLLYTHFCVRPAWNSIIRTQDPVAFAQNAAKELHNQTIDRLQQVGINGSEYLMKQLIEPVSFETSWSDWITMSQQRIAMGFINAFLTAHFLLNKDTRHTSDKSPWISYTISFLKNKNNTGNIIVTFIASSICGFISSIITTDLLYAFDQGVLADSLTLPEAIIGCIGLSAAIALVINTIQNLKLTPYRKTIDFSKEKFKDKSVKECINYYLHHPTIIMKKK